MKLAILTIYIPSYKRPESLRRQIGSLIDQTINIKIENISVRIVISLNGQDAHVELEEELSRLRQQHEFLSIHVNASNIGGNANIALGFTHGKQDGYLWILSDNDFIEGDLVERVVSCINQYREADIFILGGSPQARHEMVRYEEIANFENCPLIALGLISRGIYSMKYFANVCEIPFLYHNTSFPHLAVALGALRLNGQCTIFQIPGRAFIEEGNTTTNDYIGRYDMSYAGRLQLISLLPRRARRKYASLFVATGLISLAKAYKVYPDIAIASVAALVVYAPLVAIFSPILTLRTIVTSLRRKCLV
jgi:hypothetical protein